MVGVEPKSFQARSRFKRCCFIFFFQTFLSEVLLFSNREEYWGLYWAGIFLDGLSWRSQAGGASDLVTVIRAGRLLCGRRWSISLRMEGGSRLSIVFRLMGPNYLTPSRVVPSELELESFSNESNEVKLFWSPVSIKLDNRNTWGEMPNPKFPSTGSTGSLI